MDDETREALQNLLGKSGKKPTKVDLTSLPEGLAEFIAHLHNHLDEIHGIVEGISERQAEIVIELANLRNGSNTLAKLFMQYADHVDLTNKPSTQDHVKKEKGNGKLTGKGGEALIGFRI